MFLFRFVASSSQAEIELTQCQSLNSTLESERNQLKVLVSNYKDAADKIESDLIQKFASILNEKKAKIRLLYKTIKAMEVDAASKPNDVDNR